MDLNILPDTEDEFVGYAILSIMFFFMFVWLTSAASPINFPHRAEIGTLVGHLEVIFVALLPLTLLGIIESFYGKPQTRTTAILAKYTVKVQSFRKGRTVYRRTKKTEESKV